MINKEERIKLRDNLINILKDHSIITSMKSGTFRIKNNAFLNILQSNIKLRDIYNNYVTQFRSKDEGLYCLLHVTDSIEHLCPICKNICIFSNHRYGKTCGNRQCMAKLANSVDAKEKKRRTNLERYGVENCMQSKEVRDKLKQTMINRYGVENCMQSKEVQDKAKQTNLERYGVEYPIQNKEIQDKIKESNMKHYGVEHSMQAKEVQDKAKQTFLEHYGVDNPLKAKEVQDKIKQTNLERYGVEYIGNSKEIREKVKQTTLERYGVENCMQSKEVRDKAKQTNLERYGVEYGIQSKEIQDKLKQTNLERYGVEYIGASKEIQNKIKCTNIERYGCTSTLHNEEIANKVKQTNLERYGVEYVLQSKNIRKKSKKTCFEKYNAYHFNQKDINHYDIWSNDKLFIQHVINMYNKKGMFLVLNDICVFFKVALITAKNKIERLNLLDYFYIQQSHLETCFKDFLDQNNINYKMHDRMIIRTNNNDWREIDFLCEDKKVGIEINDINTHSDMNKGYHRSKDKQYHLNKTMRAKEKDIRLIHLWEWELRNEDEWNKVSNWLLNILDTNKVKIGARKCILKEVSLKEEKKFLNEYHLQGYKKSQVCLGLYYNNELIELASFCKPRYNKKYQYELLRLCTKYGYSVIGGAQKLLKHFINDYNPISIISYCDLSKFTGKVYEDIGFKLSYNTEPQIIWCNKDMKHFTQSSLNMIGADKMIGTNYGKGTNNVEIVQKHGYVPIYNCGLGVYTFN